MKVTNYTTLNFVISKGVIPVIALFILLLTSCGSKNNNEEDEANNDDTIEANAHPDYYAPNRSSEFYYPSTGQAENTESEPNQQPRQTLERTPYQDGYEEGYEMGYYDASCGNAEYDSYDDSCPLYKKRTDKQQYKRGYREGYDEAFADWQEDS